MVQLTTTWNVTKVGSRSKVISNLKLFFK